MSKSSEDMLKRILDRLEAVEKKLEVIERMKGETPGEPMRPALARVIKTLKDVGKPVGADEVATRAGLARNRASAYLNELAGVGYIKKEPNLKRTNSRYVFQYDGKRIPSDLREQLGEESY